MSAELLRTPLAELHEELGARMVPFAGYEMPVQYPMGILKEHLHCRAEAGLFDVSHMGQIRLTGAGAAAALERLVPGDIMGLAEGRMRYTLFTGAEGGILDDLMVTARDGGLDLVVNAGCKSADLAHLETHIGDLCDITPHFDRALLALQGPAAAGVLAGLSPGIEAMGFMTGRAGRVAGIEAIITRSGYTGEDGFEISVAAEAARDLALALLAHRAVAPIGLGARDTLRLEAGLCLHGHDIDPTTTPVEADLSWTIGRRRRAEGGYPGAQRIGKQLAEGARRRRVGLSIAGRAPVREGAGILGGAARLIGRVTSGGFAPSLGAPIAMGYVPADMAAPGTELAVDLRGRTLTATVTPMPFVPHRYAKTRAA